MNPEITKEEYAAIIILRQAKVNVLEAALLVKNVLDETQGSISRAKKCLDIGKRELRQQEKTVCFRRDMEAAAELRKRRRPRTLIDFRYFCRRLIKFNPELANRRVRSIRPTDCATWLKKAFESPHQRRKARAILSGVFTTAIQRGWCDTNPVRTVEIPEVREQKIPILTPAELTSLISTAQKYRGGNCLAAVGIMLYAGVRPHEVARLTWEQVDLDNQAIYILPHHSKTGGARKVSIHKPLISLLNDKMQHTKQHICPANWLNHWRKLRQEAGWRGSKKWRPDTLRHTFASYHLSYFRSFSVLQCEIGHRDSTLLRTRYMDQRGVVDAERFWSGPVENDYEFP